LDEAQRLLDAGRAFQAHEVLEATWKAAPEQERELWRGLAQLAVGLTHRQRGNNAGAAALLRRGADRIAAYASDPPYRIAVRDLMTWAGQDTMEAPRLRMDG
jgi:predicted metal-dependent hydrolase